MPLDFFARSGGVSSRSLVVTAPVGGTVPVDVSLEGLRFRPVRGLSIGTNVDPSSLTPLSDAEIDARFGVSGLASEDHVYDKVTYTVSLAPGGVHHAEVVAMVEENGESVARTLRVLILAVAEPEPASPGDVPFDLTVGGTFVRADVTVPEPLGTFTLARLEVKSSVGTALVSVGVPLDASAGSGNARLFAGGPPLRAGHSYTVSLSLHDPTGAGTSVVSDAPVTLKRRVVTVKLTKLLLHSDLDAATAGDFRLYARLIGRLRNPWKDREHVFVGSTAEFNLDDHDPNHLVGDKWYDLPVAPDTRDFTLVDGPTVVDDDRAEVWVRLVASENDEFETERAEGLVRLFVPNTNPRTASEFEAWIDEPINNWDWDDPQPASPPQPKNTPLGPGILTREDGDPVVTVYGTYTIAYVK